MKKSITLLITMKLHSESKWLTNAIIGQILADVSYILFQQSL